MSGEITVGGNILASHTGIDGAGSLTLGNTVVPASSYMFRNKIINGNFQILSLIIIIILAEKKY